MVGTSRSSGERAVPVTPSARSFLPSTCGLAADSTGKLICTCPLIVSSMAGPPPLYGTCMICVLETDLNNSAAMWNVLPVPAEPKLRSLAGRART